jgi:hypothetical protein
MASKRILKKSINNLTYDLVSECFTYRHFHPEQNSGINQVIQDVVKTRNELISKVNKAPKDEESAYFKGVVSEMRAMVNQLDKIEKFKK